MTHRGRLEGMLAAVMILTTVPLAAEPRAEAAAGVFRVEQRGGVWWFVDPEGQLFLLKGVDAVQHAQDRISGHGQGTLRGGLRGEVRLAGEVA